MLSNDVVSLPISLTIHTTKQLMLSRNINPHILNSSHFNTYQYTINDVSSLTWSSTAKIIHLDGKLQQFKQSIKAGHIVSQNPNCFLCSSDSMFIDAHVPQVPEDEELQLGEIYFLMPLSQSHKPLSLQELCALALKASNALTHLDKGSSSPEASPISNRPKGCPNIPKFI